MVAAVVFDLFETLITESATRPAGVASLAGEFRCDRECFRRTWKARRADVTVGGRSFRQALHDTSAALGGVVDEYVEAARRLGVDVGSISYVGDGADDELAGAAQAGVRPIRAIWFLRRWPHFSEAADDVESVRSPADLVARLLPSTG